MGLFCLVGLIKVLVGHLFVLFVVVPPPCSYLPSFAGWKMERILLQDFCNSSLHKSV